MKKKARKTKRKPRKKTKKNNKKENFETKGILVLALNVLFFLSLISFDVNYPHKNWLGFLGYYVSYLSNYLFGTGSYLFTMYLTYVSINLIKKPKQSNFAFKTISFAFLLISTSFLLNIYADSHSITSQFTQHNVFSEEIYKYRPKPHIETRYNLGGIPFFYLYTDLPFLNLKQILSSVGCTLIFTFTSFISFLMFTGMNIITILQSLFYKLSNVSKRKKIKKKKPRKRFLSYLVRSLILKIKQRRSLKKKIPLSQIKIKQPTPIIKTPASIKTEKDFSDLKINTMKTTLQPTKKPTLLDKLKSPYKLPATQLLTDPKQIDHPTMKKELTRQAEILEETLKNFAISAKVGEINCGPTITSFEVHPSIGVKVQKIKALENDIALNMQAKSIRIIAPIPGKAAVGVEVPSLYPQEVSMKEMILYYQNQTKKMHIPILLGKTVTGDYVTADLTKTPHLLIAGATGSGKSVCINTIVMSILMNSSPDDVKLMMVDPKKVELTGYSKLPHMLAPVITESHGAYAALQWLVREMHVRYDILKHLGLRNINAFNTRKIKKEKEAEYNTEIPEKMPLIVAIFDEFADLMMVSSSDLETPITRIAQMARAVGIHLILATQRPSREVITGIIKANFPSRIAFKVSSRINSQIILDEVGAESLLGNGDLLFSPPGSSQLIRAQGAFIRDEDINQIVDYICSKYPTNYLIPSFDAMSKPEDNVKSSNAKDKLYDQALDIIMQTRNASTTFLQRKLKIGYARAASLMDELESNGVIGPQDGSKPRKILIYDDQ